MLVKAGRNPPRLICSDRMPSAPPLRGRVAPSFSSCERIASMRGLPSIRRQPARHLARMASAVFALGFAFALTLGPMADAQSTGAPLVQLPSLSPVIKRVVPAVVNITVQEKGDATSDDEDTSPGQFQSVPQGSPFDQLLRRFFEQQGALHVRRGVEPRGQQEMPSAEGAALLEKPLEEGAILRVRAQVLSRRVGCHIARVSCRGCSAGCRWPGPSG